MVGWPGPLSDEAKALLPGSADHPRIPRLTGRDDVMDKIKALQPDPDPRLRRGLPPAISIWHERHSQKTGIPTLLFSGSLDNIPRVVREVGALLHREARAETVAAYAEAILALPVKPFAAWVGAHPRVLYARGADGLTVTAPNTDVTEVFHASAGWQVMIAPNGQGTFPRFHHRGDRCPRSGYRDFLRPC